ncbi:hypothetical protein [Brevibacillus agri]|uniref:hypothetical protein n=1 Tax=Brevibacillus agri TaxID=51101 RepID=UPI003D25FB1C
MGKTKLKDLVMEITCDGEKISFDDFLVQMSGNGEIYEGYIGELINVACTGNVEWDEVDDYFCPVVREVLLEAIQEDKAIFVGLAESIRFAWNRLKAKHKAKMEADREFIINKENQHVLQDVENLLHHLNDGWKIKEIVFYAPGATRVVVGKEDKEDTDHENV